MRPEPDVLVWRKSSFSSNQNNDACVEVAWRKSSFSGGADNTACVEVALSESMVAVRDSKAPGAGLLAFPQFAWQRLLAGRAMQEVDSGLAAGV
jgi:hypothetical protein